MRRWSSRLNAVRDNPAGNGSKISTTIVPGYLINRRRGQYRPELRATGTHGNSSPS